MLWSSFTLSFYGFLCASECLSLTWSDITMDDNHLVIELHQSKTDPFRRGQSIHIYFTNSSTCPVCALKLFADKISTTPPGKLVFSAGTFSPLIRPKLTEIIQYSYKQECAPPIARCTVSELVLPRQLQQPDYPHG